jgi:hypothetical protein
VSVKNDAAANTQAQSLLLRKIFMRVPRIFWRDSSAPSECDEPCNGAELPLGQQRLRLLAIESVRKLAVFFIVGRLPVPCQAHLYKKSAQKVKSPMRDVNNYSSSLSLPPTQPIFPILLCESIGTHFLQLVCWQLFVSRLRCDSTTR